MQPDQNLVMMLWVMGDGRARSGWARLMQQCYLDGHEQELCIAVLLLLYVHMRKNHGVLNVKHS